MIPTLDSNRFSTALDQRSYFVIGHRGAAGYAPENTIESIRKAKEVGISLVEFDVKLSRDNVPILFHDDTLERTTNGLGKVADHNLSELLYLDAGSWFSAQYRNTNIPTLDDAILELKRLKLLANIELKPSPGGESLTGMIVGRFLSKAWPKVLPPPIISSFSTIALQSFAKVAPSFTKALLYLDIPGNWRAQLNNLQTDTLHCLSDRLSKARVKEIINSGYILRCYTVNCVDRAAQLLEWGAHGVISDYPDQILKQLPKRAIIREVKGDSPND